MSSTSPGGRGQNWHSDQQPAASDSDEDGYDSIDSSTDSSNDHDQGGGDEFDQFSRYRGTGKIKHHYHHDELTGGPVMCLHYFSDTLGLQFGDTNEEVHKLDEIKEWAPSGSKWLEPPDLLGNIGIPTIDRHSRLHRKKTNCQFWGTI